MRRPEGASALVMGDRDLAAPLHLAQVPVTVVSRPRAPARFSRYTSGWLEDPRPGDDALAAAMLSHAAGRADPVALFYEQDEDVLFVSRRREQLAGTLRFVVADADLVERVLDKSAFQRLAEDRGLPVPAAREVAVGADPDLTAMPWPVLVKPLRRDSSWEGVTPAKAVLVHDTAGLHAFLAALPPSSGSVLVQQPVPGPESRVESYHVFVDPAGEIAAEFTGRKLCTHNAALGHSTALVTTDSPDVAALGRSVVRRLGLRGVAKLDFKRAPDGRLWLLEVNPRFTLWHHVGALAGVNIPTVVFADFLELPWPPVARARPGVSWCRVERDALAARAAGMPLMSWLRWVASCEARTGLDPRDPVPLVASTVLVPAAERLERWSARWRR